MATAIATTPNLSTLFPRRDDVHLQQQWPGSFVADRRLGALDLYRDVAGPLSEHDLQMAQVLADIAAGYLVSAHARMDAEAAAARLHHMTLHDPLTGLPNRTLLVELPDRAVRRARRSHRIAAALNNDDSTGQAGAGLPSRKPCP